MTSKTESNESILHYSSTKILTHELSQQLVPPHSHSETIVLTCVKYTFTSHTQYWLIQPDKENYASFDSKVTLGTQLVQKISKVWILLDKWSIHEIY